MARSAGLSWRGRWRDFVAGGTKIDMAEAVDVSYPGFFGQMAGGEGECGVRMHRMNHFIVGRNNPQSATQVRRRLFT
jgi:hypothetical protein